jgi:hypothetical protein
VEQRSASRLGTYFFCFFRKWGRGGRGPGASPRAPNPPPGPPRRLAAQGGKGGLCTALTTSTAEKQLRETRKLAKRRSGPRGKWAIHRERPTPTTSALALARADAIRCWHLEFRAALKCRDYAHANCPGCTQVREGGTSAPQQSSHYTAKHPHLQCLLTQLLHSLDLGRLL